MHRCCLNLIINIKFKQKSIVEGLKVGNFLNELYCILHNEHSSFSVDIEKLQ
jgi:hypothetical protein